MEGKQDDNQMKFCIRTTCGASIGRVGTQSVTGREKASPFSIFYRCDGQLCYFADFKPISLIKEDVFFTHFPFSCTSHIYSTRKGLPQRDRLDNVNGQIIRSKQQIQRQINTNCTLYLAKKTSHPNY